MTAMAATFNFKAESVSFTNPPGLSGFNNPQSMWINPSPGVVNGAGTYDVGPSSEQVYMDFSMDEYTRPAVSGTIRFDEYDEGKLAKGNFDVELNEGVSVKGEFSLRQWVD
ncbi:hypothetical protein [Pseudomonas sp. D1-2]